jgi:hypothetical protein
LQVWAALIILSDEAELLQEPIPAEAGAALASPSKPDDANGDCFLRLGITVEFERFADLVQYD